MSLTRNAGMGKRVYADYAGGYASSSNAMRRTGDVTGGTKVGYPFRYGGPKKYSRQRFYQGRGVRSGTQQLRRYRGLPRASGLGIETKFFDTSLAATTLVVPPATAAWTGLDTINPTTVLCFNAPTQGTGASNREGRYITMESLQLNGIITIAAQADQVAMDNAPTVKLFIVLDKQTNGGTATGLDSENVYTNPVGTAFGGCAPLRNMLFSKRYKVLKEIVIDPRQMTVSYDGTNMEQEGAQITFDCFIKLKGKKVEFSANAGTVADIVDHGLFIVGFASSSSMVPQITYNARLRFRG